MKKSDGTSMRYTSGILFGVLGIYNLFLTSYYLQFYGLSGSPLFSVLVIAAAIAFMVVSIKLLSKKGEVPSTWRRGLCVATIFYILFSFLTFNTQQEMISWAIFSFGKNTTDLSTALSSLTAQPDSGILAIVLFAVGILLSVVATFFASMSIDEQNKVTASVVVTDTIVETEDKVVEVEEVEEVEEVSEEK